VANIETADQGATILAGNQRVLAARLSDAKFFWENDLRVAKAGMGDWLDSLGTVTFHNKLGSQAQRIDRIAALAREIAPGVGADPDLAEQAARMAKADLSSEMVYEFPELQGIMGGYYAREAGMPDAVGAAFEAHYRPLGPSDDVPVEPVSVTVSLADKIDTLTGFWTIDEKPTGSKDPFALRRAALGVIRIILERSLRLSLFRLCMTPFNRHATHSLGRERDALSDDAKDEIWRLFAEDRIGKDVIGQTREPSETVATDHEAKEYVDNVRLLSFFADRLKVYLREQGIRHDVIEACFQLGGQDDFVLLVNRVQALQSFLETDDGANLLAGYKRASNILAAEEKKDSTSFEPTPDPTLSELNEERALFAALDAAEPKIKAALASEAFEDAMSEMAALRAPIDAFFESVTVNSDDPNLRLNRLCLLAHIRETMRAVSVWEALEG
ncbi:MAG: glycine--tRNA ligase subunit beta, partial [Pseudomonadota bacterium]